MSTNNCNKKSRNINKTAKKRSRTEKPCGNTFSQAGFGADFGLEQFEQEVVSVHSIVAATTEPA